jgi:hypothetical protein
MFFHSYSEWNEERQERPLDWQGTILEKVTEDVYLVETYDWVIGMNRRLHLVTLQEMVRLRWSFYETREEMMDYFDHHYAARADRNA